MSIGAITTRGLGSFTTIKDYITRGYSIGDSSIISDADAAKIASYVWEYIIFGGFQAQDIMKLIPNMLALQQKNKSDHKEITACLNDIKEIVIPLRGSIQDADRNQLRGRGKNGNK
jgi:hypothetical protein